MQGYSSTGQDRQTCHGQDGRTRCSEGSLDFCLDNGVHFTKVLTILGKDLDKLVVVGGWVPELTFPQKGHVGSLDVDLALDPSKLKPLAYESIRTKLVDSGYWQDTEAPNRFWSVLASVQGRTG